jgi:ACS family sodium-dependent inorganic phosphate cotransporter
MFWRKRRYVVAIMGFFGFFSMYTLQSNLNIAIVAMTENKTIVLDNNTVVYVSLDNLKKLQILNHCLEARI